MPQPVRRVFNGFGDALGMRNLRVFQRPFEFGFAASLLLPIAQRTFHVEQLFYVIGQQLVIFRYGIVLLRPACQIDLALQTLKRVEAVAIHSSHLAEHAAQAAHEIGQFLRADHHKREHGNQE